MKRLLIICLLLLLPFSTHAKNNRLKNAHKWICYYGSSWPSGTDFSKYDLLIFQTSHHPPLFLLNKKKQIALGYVSFGEIVEADPFFKEAKKAKITVDKNKNWASHRVDMRSEAWHKHIIEEKIPKVLKQGFQGIFIDTIDTAAYLEHDKKISGSLQGAIKLIKKVRKHYPKMVILLNNGFAILNEVGNEIDGLLVDDVYTLYDFEKKTYQLASEAWMLKQKNRLDSFQKKFPKPVFALDYLSPKQSAYFEQLRKRAYKDKYRLYISDIHLEKIFF